MPRTTPALVQGLLKPGKDYDQESDLSPFVASATVVVSRVATCAAAKGKTLSAEELELVERWLAAHMYMMSDQQYSSKSTAGASASFRVQGGLNLDGSTYGQNARMVDFSGCLEAISKRQTAGGFWAGKPPSEQIPYEERS